MAATVRIESIDVHQTEVTGFGEPMPSYVTSGVEVAGAVVTPGGVVADFHTRLVGDEIRELMALLNRVGERVMVETREALG